MKLSFIERQIANYLYPTKNCMVHVGKCGGSTIKYALRYSNQISNYTIAHTYPIPFSKDISYFLQLRHPIKRLISAYNWRYTRLVVDGEQREKFRGELDALMSYDNFDDLACDLYCDDKKNKKAHQAFNRIRHLKQGYQHHMKFLLRHDGFKERIKGVFFQETLNQNIKEVLNADVHINRNVNKRTVMPTNLSNQALVNLKKIARKDYEVLETLYQWGFIPDEIYEYYLR